MHLVFITGKHYLNFPKNKLESYLFPILREMDRMLIAEELLEKVKKELSLCIDIANCGCPNDKPFGYTWTIPHGTNDYRLDVGPGKLFSLVLLGSNSKDEKHVCMFRLGTDVKDSAVYGYCSCGKKSSKFKPKTVADLRSYLIDFDI